MRRNYGEIAKNLDYTREHFQKMLAGRVTVSDKHVKNLIFRYPKLGDIDPIQLSSAEPNAPFIEVRRRSKLSDKPFLVPMVPHKARAGYVRSYDQVDYLTHDLEQFALPPNVDPRGAVWRYFEVGGDSMEPELFSGDVILASMVPVDDWQSIKQWHLHIVLTDEDLVIKRIYRKSKTEWALISVNEEKYPQRLIKVETIREVWVPRRITNSRMPPSKKFELKV